MCAAEQEPALGFPTQMSLPGEQTAPIPCMAQELELQARQLEEQHSMQALERCACASSVLFCCAHTTCGQMTVDVGRLLSVGTFAYEALLKPAL